MKGKVIKLFRCPESGCTMQKRTTEPTAKAPPCPKCHSKRAYFSDDWYISYTLPNGKPQLEAVSPFKDQAVARLLELGKRKAEIIHDPFKAPLKWEDAKKHFMEYIEKTADRKGTISFYKNKVAVLDKYMPKVAPTMDKVDIDTFYAIRTLRKDVVSPNTINKEIAALRYICAALSDGRILREVDGKKIPWLEHKPLTGKYKPLEEIPPPEVYVEPAEMDLLLSIKNDTFMHCYILMAGMSALRRRTVMEFRREWINWKLNRFEIPPAGRKRGKGKIHYVSIAAEVRGALQKVWASYRPYMTPDVHNKWLHERKDSYFSATPREEPYTTGFLFCHPADPEQMWGGFDSAWQKLKKQAGINKRYHDLKHTAGTLYQWANADIKATTDFLDESTYFMAARYIRDSDAIRNQNMQKFESLFQLKVEPLHEQSHTPE